MTAEATSKGQSEEKTQVQKEAAKTSKVETNRSRFALATCLTIPLAFALYLLLHIIEQWSAFGLRDAYAQRILAWSYGPWSFAKELVGLVSSFGLLWVNRDCFRETANVRTIVRISNSLHFLVFAGFLLVHLLCFAIPKHLGAAPSELYGLLFMHLGNPAKLALHLLGLTSGLFLFVRCLQSPAVQRNFRETQSASSMRAASIIAALFLLVLGMQLLGWFATGTGIFWPIRIHEANESPEDAMVQGTSDES